MALEESSQTSGVGSRYLGEGFRQEADFREATTATVDPIPTTTSVTESDQAVTVTGRSSTPNLSYVFDDPADGEPGRDRMLVHGLWELLLALGLAAVGYLLYRERAGDFSGTGLQQLVLGISVLGLVAAGGAVALRAAVPNLAVGAVAVAAGLLFGHDSAGGLAVPLLVVVGVCAVIGLVQGFVIVGLHVPAWAASVGVALALLVWSERQSAVTFTDGYGATAHAYLWLGGFFAVSVLAGLIGLVPGLRRALGRFRPIADPAGRRGLLAALIALVATMISTVLAGLGGVLAVSVDRTAAPSDGLVLTGLALGAALLGGTSAFGRRGGIFGTAFAAALLAVAMQYAEVTNRPWPPAAFAAAAVGLGLAVTRLVERFGRPPLGADKLDDEDWVPKVHTSAATGWSPAAKSGTTSLGLWASDEAWGSTDER